MIYEYRGFKPVIDPSSYVHPQANVTGNVIIGKKVYIGPSAVLRGDFGKIIVEDGCNIQENCTIHMFPTATVILRRNVHIGHGAIVHGGIIEENCLIGMNSVIMDDCIIEKESIVGALCFVPAKMKIPKRSLVVGNPAKIIKEVSEEMIAWKTKGTELYQTLPKLYSESIKECQALTKIEPNRPKQEELFETWNDFKNKNS